MYQKNHQKSIPSWDQGALLTVFSYIKKSPNEVLPIFLYLEYYEEILVKKTRSRSAPLRDI